MPAQGNSICQLACSGTPETTRSGWRGALYSFNGKTRRMAFCLDRNPDLGQARFVLYGRHNRHFREIDYLIEWRGPSPRPGSSPLSNCLEMAACLRSTAVMLRRTGDRLIKPRLNPALPPVGRSLVRIYKGAGADRNAFPRPDASQIDGARQHGWRLQAVTSSAGHPLLLFAGPRLSLMFHLANGR